jgi:hypothetical protein
MRPADEFIEVEMRGTQAVFCGFCLTSESVVVVVATGPDLHVKPYVKVKGWSAGKGYPPSRLYRGAGYTNPQQ